MSGFDTTPISSRVSYAMLKGVLPENYGYVVLVACEGVAVNFYLAKNVVEARKHFNVPYPALYSADNQVFNCIQRAHQNYLETFPIFTTSLLIGGLQNPTSSAVAGFIFLALRVLSAQGYSTGDPEKRKVGGPLGMICYLVLFGNMICFGAIHSGLFNCARGLFRR